MASTTQGPRLPRLRLAARYRLLQSEASGSFRKLAKWVRRRASNRSNAPTEEYDEPWVRDMVERS